MENEIMNEQQMQDSTSLTQPPIGGNMPNQGEMAMVDEARKALGLDAIQNEINALRAEAENAKNEALYKDNMAGVLGKYPELTKEAVESELAKLDENAQAFYKSNKSGLELFAKNLKETISPKTKADDITDDSQTSANKDSEDDELLKKIRSGKASNTELGIFLTKGY